MKKIFSHPMFYCIFAVLGLAGMFLQTRFFETAADEKGLLAVWHPLSILTFVLLALVIVLTVASARYIRAPKYPIAVRSIGAGLATLFTAIATLVLLRRQNYLLCGLCALSTLSSVYILWTRLKKKKPHYSAYSIFAVCFMFYLISRYQAYSAEPETARYVFKILALVCMMLVFYQTAALRAHTGRFGSYHFWRSLALFLSLTAIPSSTNPMLYLAAAVWLIVDPAAPPVRKAESGSDAP